MFVLNSVYTQLMDSQEQTVPYYTSALEEPTKSAIDKAQTVEARQKVKIRNPTVFNAQTGRPALASENVDVGIIDEVSNAKTQEINLPDIR
ncbi:MAG: hypothetical protein Q9199_007338 [Rusavskia elegans]